MRRVILLAVVFLLTFADPVGADRYRGGKTVSQDADGSASVTVMRDGSVPQTARRTGAVTCVVSDVASDPGAPGQIGRAHDQPEQMVEGHYYWIECFAADGRRVSSRLFRYDPAEPTVSGADLGARARSELDLRFPEPRTNPDADRMQLVGVDTWLWVDPATWQPRSATASIPGLSATVTAQPTHVTWDMGDGTTVRCDGPGTPYDPDRPAAAQRTDCSHLYQHVGSYQVSATVHWSVTWSSTDGDGGTLADVARTTRFTLDVAERQAVGRPER